MLAGEASGSGGLVGTISDYFKFAQCLLDNMKGRASGVNGVRLLGRCVYQIEPDRRRVSFLHYQII